MQIHTIGFTRKSAEQFFEALKRAGIRRLVDIRLHNVSQLAGFSKRDDLAYFLRELCGCEYLHEPLLSPTQEIFDALKKQGGAWSDYEPKFLALMASRRVEERIAKSTFDVPTVLLCTEPTSEHCHRRLVVEYLDSRWGDVRRLDL